MLFCMSAFALAINVPAGTFACRDLRKFDGKPFANRLLLYIQMSPRAGRRRLGSDGSTVIICRKTFPAEAGVADHWKRGEALESQFHIRSNIVLNGNPEPAVLVSGPLAREKELVARTAGSLTLPASGF
jgi:superfamily II RNA helicase